MQLVTDSSCTFEHKRSSVHRRIVVLLQTHKPKQLCNKTAIRRELFYRTVAQTELNDMPIIRSNLDVDFKA